MHSRIRPGCFAPRSGETETPSSSQRAYTARLLGRCGRIGDDLAHWAEAAIEERGVRALRLIQGALSLVRKHPKEVVLYAARTALKHRLFRYKDLARLAEMGAARLAHPKPLLAEDEHIRPLDHYSLEAL